MKMSSTFGIDPERASKGVWLDLGEGARVLVARMPHPEYEAELERQMKPHTRRLRAETMSRDEQQAVIRSVMARTIVLNWENIEDTDENGKVVSVQYSEQAALRLLTKFPEFFRLVMEFAQSSAAYRAEEREESVKN